MNDAPLAPDVVESVASGFSDVAAEFADEIGGVPTLAEFLEILGWAVPTNNGVLDGSFPQPSRFTATLKGSKRYGSDRPSRVPELNDHVFEDARELCATVAERINAASGDPVTPQQFASAILQVLQTAKIALADISGDEVRKVLAETSGKSRVKLVPGDVLAIPVLPGGYRLAVVITRNRFGTALGLFEGLSPQGRLTADILRAPKTYIYTEESLVKNGTWKIVAHDESLLGLFPADPEIYHKPGAWPGIDTGEFGAAETANGPLRMIDAQEAREVGLQDGTYRQVHTAAYLQKLLGKEMDSS